MVTVNNYYNNIPVGRDLNNLPNTSSAGTTVGYQYDGLTEEDRFVQKVLHAETVNVSVNMSDLFYLSSIKRERGTDYPFANNIQFALSVIF